MDIIERAVDYLTTRDDQIVKVQQKVNFRDNGFSFIFLVLFSFRAAQRLKER